MIAFRSYNIALQFAIVIGALVAQPLLHAADNQPVDASATYKGWKHTGSLYILTTPEGADLPATATLENFPLLLRLHKDFFDFTQAKANGEDLRLASGSGQPLAFQIEAWDSAQGIASVWVRVPSIKGNARQELKLFWGKADAPSESNGKAVFNESNGYASVWHMNETVQDEVGTLPSNDVGTTATSGMIGIGRHFPGKKGIFCGDKIPGYPSGSSSHSTEAWFRAEVPNSTLIGWGNEGGGRGSKIRMQLRSPLHVHIDSDFSDVRGERRLALNEWIHVVHTYDREDGKIYINGQLDAAAKPLLNIKSPSRLWLGGWYNNYDFVGDIDEVRISRVARSADWIKLQYENQKPNQTAVGPIVPSGSEFAVPQAGLVIQEGQSITVSARAGGAQKVFWTLKQNGKETVVATDRFSYKVEAGRVVGDQQFALEFKAIYPQDVKTQSVPITVKEAVAEPIFTLAAPAHWDARQTIEVVPKIENLSALQSQGADKLNYTWTVADIAVISETPPGKLVLKRAQNSGKMQVSVAIDNGGEKTVQTTTIDVKEPAKDAWIDRSAEKDEKPEDGQFYARDDKNQGTLHYNGTLDTAADSVFLRVYADDQLFKSDSQKLPTNKEYSFSVRLNPGLVKYRVDFGSKTGDRESISHKVENLICGDAYLIDGQSNAEATDVGKEDPTFTSDWIRSYGSMNGDPSAKSRGWTNATVRNRQGGKGQIGAWGMELAKQLVENNKIPICIINGAVGGSRIDVHQRNHADPTDPKTIYGRLLGRIQQARLTHGIRGAFWHQGENDQGADGPTGGFGWETYQQYFIEMTAAWKQDYPNIQNYYTFQIWPKSCSMGVNGSDNKLREVQRNLPTKFSNLSVMSTLGIKPPGGCHYPLAGYAEFARLIGPLVERDNYGAKFTQSITAPNLKRAYFTNSARDEINLEFDQNIKWTEPLASQFYLDGESKHVFAGSATGNLLTLRLKSPTKAHKITYLDSASWNPDNLLYGENGIAALTFCDVPIQSEQGAQ